MHRTGRLKFLGSRKSFVLTCGASLMLAFVGSQAQADTLNVNILPSGSQSFLEGTMQSGQIAWSTTDQGLVIPPSNYDIYFRFQISIEADADNVPEDSSVSVLSLIEWPTAFPETLTWDFELVSGAIDGPLDTWTWSTGVLFTSGLTFDTGQVIAACDWQTFGNDIDDFPDDGSFELGASVSVVYQIPLGYLIRHYAADSKFLNPEPIPEPTSLIVLALGALGFLRRRRNRICFLT